MTKSTGSNKRNDSAVRAKALEKFRAQLDELERKSQDSYDKAILTLSGGALGVTISFVKDVVGDLPQYPQWLLTSWILFGAVACCEFCFRISSVSMRCARPFNSSTPEPWAVKRPAVISIG